MSNCNKFDRNFNILTFKLNLILILSKNLTAISIKPPCLFHKANEMFIYVNTCTNCSIVVIPFGLSDGAITILVTEALQELNEDLIRTHLS